MPLDFGDPPRVCDMPHRPFVDEPKSGGRATSRSRAPLLSHVLAQGPFLLLTYSCTSGLYCRCYSHVLVNVLVHIHAYSAVLVSFHVQVHAQLSHICVLR